MSTGTAVRRTALVTGANRGLGRAVCAALLARGHRVVVAGRDEEAAERAAADLGGGTLAAVLDVTDDKSVRDCLNQVGTVDILVNNAGILADGGTAPDSVPLDLVESHLRVNTLGAWRVSQAFLPGMLERGWGRIVMVSSGVGAFSNGLFAGAPAYAVSKAALNAVTVLLAQVVRDRGVLVNAVNPGKVRTRMYPSAERTPEEAAADIAWAATLPEDGPTGAFLRGRRQIPW
ncbi:SDR family NAD(P)-dependent oxidoreductase [Nonomuraea sp. PA05]|uniref:SDR family NAD(P)-dependent oxidoreductase n=1 Tax=Nonomuraea sp. PA05 TaxID=2604466 RepID=UPI0011D352B8|nr:SDR family NAD(P)-dependent oxidoreductase [Nonomuraea sp. PA05]TYB60557.1 SDR family NAD(P)-dependent oxidoreductase [Nonomuraea sp. PA05]